MEIQVESIFSIALIFTRAGALFMAVPVLGGQSLPLQVRLALGLLVAVILSPLVPSAPLAGTHALWLILAMLFELIVGALMGLAIQAVFATIEFAAQTIAMETGLTPNNALSPVSEPGEGSGVTGLLFFFAIIIFLVTGMHHQVIAALARSFHALPVGAIYTRSFSLDALAVVTTQIFVVGLLMAAPFIAINFLINMTFALLGKIAPKMNVFMVSFAVRIMAGFLALISTAGLLAHYINAQFELIPSRMMQLILGN